MSIQGMPFEVTVVGCYNLKDKEWISRQDPYVCLEYGSARYKTRTCTDGGKNPTFQEKFVFTLIEGLRELNVVVWNSNTVVADDLIGSGRIQLHKVLTEGYDDCTWPLQSKTGRHSGEVRLILHYSNAKATVSQPAQTGKIGKKKELSMPEYAPYTSVSPYGYPPAPSAPYIATAPYAAAPIHSKSYSTPTSDHAYPPSPYAGYPPQPPAVGYPPQAPPAGYPPTYPPAPQASTYYPPAPAGFYPPPPY